MSKYHPLFVWLNRQTANRIVTAFLQVETVLKFDLPDSARTYRQWWDNDPCRVQAKAWLNAGFRTENVNLQAATVNFVRGGRPSS